MRLNRDVVCKHPARVLFCISLILLILVQLQDLEQIVITTTSTSTSSSSAITSIPRSSSSMPSATTTNSSDTKRAAWDKHFPPPPVSSSQKIHITHVFSSFATPKASLAYKEMSVVQLSLLRASEYARERHGIHVEFLDTTLPHDSSSSPAFATRLNLTAYFISANNDGSDAKQIPTVGEYFSLAHERGRGEFVVSTNADIGVVEDFYVRAYAWANQPYATSPQVQLLAMDRAARFFASCVLRGGGEGGGEETSMESVRFCAQDTRQVYVNEGGFEQLYTRHMAREIALLACQSMLPQMAIRDRKWFEAVLSTIPQSSLHGAFHFEGGGEGGWMDEVVNFSPQGPSEAELPFDALFAGTITRLDFPDADEVLKRQPSLDAALAHVLHELPKRGATHPGNDLFIMHRRAIPLAKLDQFAHPTGLRPFGAWIPVLLSNYANIAFRRIASTRAEPWSFHIGLGKWGGSKINFRERLENNPHMTLFLAGNFNRLGEGVFERQFTQAPRLCKESLRGWRDTAFCQAKSSSSQCVGVMRLSCEKYMNANMRDPRLYAHECERLMSAGGKQQRTLLQEPVCSLCNFLLNSAAPCAKGKMKFCAHLAKDAC